MSIKIYYHPSVSINIRKNQLKDNFNWNISRSPIESYSVNLHNKDENLQHLPDDVFYNIANHYLVNIDNDGNFRNDKVLNFIRDCIFEKKYMSIFLFDPFPEIPLSKEEAKRLQIIAFGEEFDIPTKHTQQSPLTKENKPIFVSVFFEYSMPLNNESEELMKVNLLKF